MYEWLLKGKFLKTSLREFRSTIEFTTSTARPLVNVYSKKEFHRLCKEAGFQVIKTHIRKLERADLPGIPYVMKLYKFIPESWLDFIAKKFGWYLSVRIIKAKV